ncbi:tyrosine-type recombinase/integrase, partial [Escherichia coli]|uniref:tyrosine-type recombinase/integrase n=1 Tax=Escherichia coli TaxID=562 RepID=UPI0027DDB37F
MSKRRYLTGKEVQAMMQAVCYGATGARDYCLILLAYRHGMRIREGANKQVISSQADSLIKISRIWADFFPANTSNQP